MTAKAKKTPAKPKRRPKQQTLPGVELNIPEIDEAAAEYIGFRDARMQNLGEEVKAGERLLKIMKDHKLTVYQYDGKDVMVKEIEKVSVRKKKSESNGESREDE